MKNIILTIFAMGLIFSIYTQSISVTGDWNFTVPPSEYTEAGEDIGGNYESAVNQMYMNIESNDKWEVSVQRYDISWNDDFLYAVRRTGDGVSGKSKIKGGTDWKEIKDGISEKLFEGEKTILSIPFQYKIDGVSVTIPAYVYSTEVVFTIKKR